MAREFDVIALCVDYLQSGRAEGIEDERPYDFGWLQALDALRAVGYVQRALISARHPFHASRLYAVGGSGGANVALMANKLAPRSFAGVVALSGMAKLNDDIAYGEPGGSPLSARWSRDPRSPYYLSPDAQDLRFVGHPVHLAEMKRLGNRAQVLVVHGVDDPVCPVADARELVSNLEAAGLPVEPVWVDADRVDGTLFRAPDHAVGDRTQLVLALAGSGLRPDSPAAWTRRGPSDFDRNDDIRYVTSGGAYVVAYRDGIPEGRFEARGR
jgi:predicted esterase